MKTKLQEIFLKAEHLFVRYPMVLTMAFLATVGVLIISDSPSAFSNNFEIKKFALVSTLGISLMFALKMLSQRIGKELLLQVLGIGFLIGFYFVLPKEEKFFTEQYAFLVGPTFILSHLFVAFAAFLNKGKEIYFWQFNKNLFVNLFLTIVFTGVLTGGVELAILATDKLFDLDVVSQTYLDIFLTMLIFGSCFIFLLFNENGLRHLEKDDDYPVILKFFTQFILIPLLFIYLVILYLYGLKITINWELPRGWVSYLILAYSVVGILALLLVHPLKEASAKSWVKGFSKIFYYTLVPLLVLLYIAIFTRILEYGFTEARYFVLLIGLWLTSVVMYFIFSKKTTIQFIPISLFVFGVFALIFPYLNAFSVAKRSQKNELNLILTQNNLLSNGTIDFDKNINAEIASEVSNKFEFLTKRKEFDYLQSLIKNPQHKKELKESFEQMNFWKSNFLISGYFTNKNERQDDLIEKEFQELVSSKTEMNIENYHYISTLRKLKDRDGAPSVDYFMQVGEDKIRIEEDVYDLKRSKFLVSLNGGEKINLMPQFINFFENYPKNETWHQVPEIKIEADLGKYKMIFLFDRISKTSQNYYFDNAGTTLVLVQKK